MSTSSNKAKRLLDLFARMKSFDEVLEDIVIDQQKPQAEQKVPEPLSWTKESQQKRLTFLREQTGMDLGILSGKTAMPDPDVFQGNIENYIGLTQVPTGVIGPLHILGTEARGDFYVPLATTEGALVASYHRGAKATRLSGGIVSVCLTEGVQRSPLFKFESLHQVGKFMQWVLTQMDAFHQQVNSKSRYAKLEDMRLNMEGNQVVLVFEYSTGDAAGQNMVTLCTEAICTYIIENSPVKPECWFIESNYSGDKKATTLSFTSVRGKKVTAEAVVTRKVVKEVLGTTPEDIARYWQSSSVTAVQSGGIGIQGHFANGLTALFMATGQDVACVSEAYVGITRMEVNKKGDLYVSVTLPSLTVGTVGGGTGLPSQQECLQLIGCAGLGTARKFAEICGATVLAGELSIAAAIANGNFSKAHRLFGRKK
jgi:hydroxymethylglutaryl-CoA reductase (NADPH)